MSSEPREVESLRKELDRERRDHKRTMEQRDHAEDMADQLAYHIAPIDVIGEHSSANDPWQNALDESPVAAYRADLEAKVRGLRPADNHDPNYMVPLAAIEALLTDGAEPPKGAR